MNRVSWIIEPVTSEESNFFTCPAELVLKTKQNTMDQQIPLELGEEWMVMP